MDTLIDILIDIEFIIFFLALIFLFLFFIIWEYIGEKKKKKEAKREERRKEQYDAEIKRKEQQQRARIKRGGKVIVYLRYMYISDNDRPRPFRKKFVEEDVVKTGAALSEANVDFSDIFLTAYDGGACGQEGYLAMAIKYKDEYKEDEDQGGKLARRSKFVTNQIEPVLREVFKKNPIYLQAMFPEIEGF